MALCIFRSGPAELLNGVAGHFPPAIDNVFRSHRGGLTRALSEQQQDFQRRALRAGLVERLPEEGYLGCGENALAALCRISLDAVTRIDLHAAELLFDRKTEDGA